MNGYMNGYANGYNNGYWNGYYNGMYNNNYFNSYDNNSYHYGPRENTASNGKVSAQPLGHKYIEAMNKEGVNVSANAGIPNERPSAPTTRPATINDNSGMNKPIYIDNTAKERPAATTPTNNNTQPVNPATGKDDYYNPNTTTRPYTPPPAPTENNNTNNRENRPTTRPYEQPKYEAPKNERPQQQKQEQPKYEAPKNERPQQQQEQPKYERPQNNNNNAPRNNSNSGNESPRKPR